MVGGGEVRDLKCQILHAVVLEGAEGNRQADMTQGVGHLAEYNPVEGFVTGCHLGEVKLHLLQGLCEYDVQAAPSVDEGFRQQSTVKRGIDDQRVGPKVWYMNPMIFPGEGYGVLRPPQVFGSFSVDEGDLVR